MPASRFTPLIAALPATVPFVAAEAMERARGAPFRARIGANESVFGPSPKAVAAMRAAADDVWLYGDPEVFELKAAIAAAHGVTPDHVVVGEGIDALLGQTVRLFVEAGTPVVTSQGGYPTFDYHVAGHGGSFVRVPYVDDREDLDGLIAAADRSGAPLAYFANPDNPMATWWEAAAVEAAVARLPAGTLLILDEAYGEFAPAGVLPRIDPDDPRVLRFRTFSKAHGMAGLRVAYGIGAPEVTRAFDKIRNHFGIGRIAQAGALAALGDGVWLAEVIAAVNRSKARIAAIAAANGLTSLPSATNFVAVDCGRDGAFARAVLDGLIARDLFVRKPGLAPMDRCIRISAGTDADLHLLAAALPLALADAAAAVVPA
ncbi:pyridoxal phosphate-dependent aminotransferase [Siculibacillus lacustris]|uniref:Pyridoxal phosphate-dependent aminotransferase n=1 Tax=Siculibacillus lacustris TaxID=1549641 RepID=A0A4Q9VHH0_9HYPH|nr:pyridoxal phosphate-dependent aminotransferase [Siculibacillus lacustris]TBW33692.1 pyridoxal phosphate-dependent aminotransferase [Siculibacillus lacustris]